MDHNYCIEFDSICFSAAKKSFLCHICHKSFSRQNTVNQHRRKLHKIDEKVSKPFTCNFCEKSYNYLRSLNAHRIKVHNVKHSKRDLHFEGLHCILCQDSVSNFNLYQEHLASMHDIKLEIQKDHFSNLQEFESWKNQLGENSPFGYRQLYRKDGVSVYTCNRNRRISELNKRKRINKKTLLSPSKTANTINNPKFLSKSDKLPGHCPCRYSVKQHSNGTYDLVFYKTHLRHSWSFDTKRFTKQERNHVLKKIELSIPSHKIQEQCHVEFVRQRSSKLDTIEYEESNLEPEPVEYEESNFEDAPIETLKNLLIKLCDNIDNISAIINKEDRIIICTLINKYLNNLPIGNINISDKTKKMKKQN